MGGDTLIIIEALEEKKHKLEYMFNNYTELLDKAKQEGQEYSDELDKLYRDINTLSKYITTNKDKENYDTESRD